MNTQIYAWRQITTKDIPPTPKWLPIDRDNLYPYEVAAFDINDKASGVQCGILENHLCVNKIGLSVNGIVSYPYTHYIPLADLLNLPISE